MKKNQKFKKMMMPAIAKQLAQFVVGAVLIIGIIHTVVYGAQLLHEHSGYCEHEKCTWFWCRNARCGN